MAEQSNQGSGAVNSLMSSLESLNIDESAFNETGGGDINIDIDFPDEPVTNNVDVSDETIALEPEPEEGEISFDEGSEDEGSED